MGKRRAVHREQDEDEEEHVDPCDVPDAEVEAPMMEDDGGDAANQVNPGDEMQEIAFDVNEMEDCDHDGVFHVLQRWCPQQWCVDLDDVIKRLAAWPITSIVKIPHLGAAGAAPVTQAEEEDGEVYGVLGLFDFRQASSAVETLMPPLRNPAITEEVSKNDLSKILDPAHMEKYRVAMIVNERMTNLPPELGAQLMVNLFEELEEHEEGEAAQAAQNGRTYQPFEYFITMMKVRMNADKELEGLEAEEARIEEAKTGKKPVKPAGKKPAKRARPATAGDETLAIDEETTLFYRPEEIFFFRNRVEDIAVKRYVLDEEKSTNVCVAPVVIHRSKLNQIIKGIKTLDDYWGGEA